MVRIFRTWRNGSWSLAVPNSILTFGRKLPLALLVIAPALALAGCGSQAENDMETRLARAEAAATRAENAQKAAEEAAKRAENDKIAAASEEVDLAPREPQDSSSNEPTADMIGDPNSANTAANTPANTPG